MSFLSLSFPPRPPPPQTITGMGTEKIAQVWIWYFDTQLEMTSQSRFAKNASM